MKASYRSNLVQRMGGEFGFDFLVVAYCENILDDEDLDKFFANFDLKALTYLQKEMLLISFLDPNQETKARRKRVRVRNEKMGLDQSHFTILEQHFIAALDDCSIVGLDYELCKAYFAELRPLFKECTMASKYRENIVERMGGEDTFEQLVESYCERIQGDTNLNLFFQGYDLQRMVLLQEELILMAFLQPSVENNVEVLKRKVTSRFSRMFALGMNADHFEMMEGHFTAALHSCLSSSPIIEISSKLFSKLISFFEEYGRSLVENDDDESDDEDDKAQAPPVVCRRYSTGSRLSPLPYKKGIPSHIEKKISAALNASDNASESTETTADVANESSFSSHASRKPSDFDNSPEPSMRRANSGGFLSQLAAATPKKKMGRPKLNFSWKSPMFKGKKLQL